MWSWLIFLMVGCDSVIGHFRNCANLCSLFETMSTSSSSAPRASPKSFYFVQKTKSQEDSKPQSRGSPKLELHNAPQPRAAQREAPQPSSLNNLSSWVTGLFRRSDHAYQPIDGQKVRKVCIVSLESFISYCLFRCPLKLNLKCFLLMKEHFLLGYTCR